MHGRELELLFGREKLVFDLPSGVAVQLIEKPAMPVLADPVGGVEAALDSGVGLAGLAAGCGSACIVICDITRPVPNGLFLGPMVRRLIAAGVPRDRITVLVATGLHRPNLGEELRELIGDDWVLETVRVENHDALDDAMHVDVGRTQRGTRVRIDRRFVEADLRVVTGLVEPHFMAGYSGGRKVIAPGIAHAETIRTFHNTDFMEDAGARNCNLAGNPLHGEQIEIVEMVRGAFALNTVLDADRRLSFVNFGEVIESHREAVETVRCFAEVPIAKPVPLVITSGAGYPLDQTFYQTIKGMVGALGALAPGGTMLIASECAEGLGSGEFREAQADLVTRGPEGFLESARTRPLARIDEWQTVKLAHALRAGRLHLFSRGLDESAQNLTGVTCHTNWTEALAAVLAESGAREVAVIPEGPYAIPICPHRHI